MLNLPVKNKGQRVEVVACDKCRCTWLTKLRVNRYSTLPQSLAMEPVPIHTEGDFNLLLCAACGNVVFPPIEGFMTASAAHQLYEEMAHEVAGSAEIAEERLAGLQLEKIAKGVFGHIPEAGDHKPLYQGYYQEKKKAEEEKKRLEEEKKKK